MTNYARGFSGRKSYFNFLPAIFGFVSALFAAGLFSSCALINDIKSFEKPESVTLKLDGQKYSVPLGDARAYLKDHASAEKIQEIIDQNISDAGKTSKVSVYEYDDKKATDVQKYIFDYSVADVPLDISEWLSKLDNMDLDTLHEQYSRQIEVPALGDMDFSKSEDLDFNKIIGNIFDCSFLVPEVPETGSELEKDLPTIVFSITNPDFNWIQFKEGNLELTFAPAEGSTPSSDYTVKARAVVSNSSGTEIAVSAGHDEYDKADEDDYVTVVSGSSTGDKLLIPLTGNTNKFTKNLRIDFSIKISGGEAASALHFNDYDVTLKFSSDTKVSKVSGLTISDDDLSSEAISVSKSVDTSSISDVLKGATIGSGSMEYYLKIPAGWTGITVEPSITMAGGLVLGEEDFENVSAASEYVAYRRADLAGKKLFPDGPADIEISGSIPFHVKKAYVELHYDDSGNSTDTVDFNASTTLGEFTDAKVSVSTLLDTSELSKSYAQQLDEDITKFIKQINFTTIGLTGTVTTDLPKSDMMLTASLSAGTGMFEGLSVSDAVDFSEDSPYTISLSKTYDDDVLDAEEGIKGKTINLSSSSIIAFDVAMDVESADGTDTITFASIVPGTTYNLDFDISFNYDWYSVVLDPAVSDLQGDIAGGIDLGAIIGDSLSSNEVIQDILDKVNFKDDAIKGYIFVTKPDIPGLNDFAKLKGTASVNYTGVESGYTQLFPASGGSDEIEFVATTNSLSSIANSKRVIYDIGLVKHSGELSGPALVKFFNEKPESETISYNFGLTGSDGTYVTIKKSELEDLKSNNSSTSICISLAMVVALHMEVTDDIEIPDVFGVFGKGIEDDLLGRADASEESDYKKYADLVQLIQLDHLFINNTGFAVSAGFSATNEGGTTYLEKTIALDQNTTDTWSKRSKLTLNDKDIDSMFSNYPFIPTIQLTISAGEVTVPQNAFFSAKAVLTAVTKGDYVIWGGDDD